MADWPQAINRPHADGLRQIKWWQAHICGEGTDEPMIGITFFDMDNVPFADTHMTLAGACDLLDTIGEVVVAFRKLTNSTTN